MAELNKKLHLLKLDSTQEAIKLYSALAEVGDNHLNVKVPAYTEYYKWTPWAQPVLNSNGALGGTDFAVWGTVGSISGKEPYYMFDNNSSTYYRGKSTASIIIYNPIALKITNILWEKYYSYPKSGNVQGSNDGITYTTIVNFTNATNGNFDIVLSGNNTAYNYYKINITSVNDDVVHCSGLTITATYAAIATVSDYDYVVEVPAIQSYAKLAKITYYKWQDWTQPILTSNTSFGVVTASNYAPDCFPYLAMDGILTANADGHAWNTDDSYTGWWQIKLPYSIRIYGITFTNGGSPTSNVRNISGRFYADSAKTIPIGDAISTPSTNGYVTQIIGIPAEGIITDTIYFEKTGGRTYAGIGELDITAKYAVESTADDYDYVVNPVNASSLSMVVSGVKYKVLTKANLAY